MIGIWKHFFNLDRRFIATAMVIAFFGITACFLGSWWSGLLSLFVYLFVVPCFIYLIDYSMPTPRQTRENV